MSMGRSENVAIFENTRKMYQTDPELVATVQASNHIQENRKLNESVAKRQ